MELSKLLGELTLLQGDAEQSEAFIDDLMGRIDKALKWNARQQEKAQKTGRLADYQRLAAEESALTAAYTRLSEARAKMNLGGAIPEEVKTDA